MLSTLRDSLMDFIASAGKMSKSERNTRKRKLKKLVITITAVSKLRDTSNGPLAGGSTKSARVTNAYQNARR